MSRHDRLYLSDMIAACEKVQACIEALDREAFEADWIRYDAVLRNLETMGRLWGTGTDYSGPTMGACPLL